MGWKLFRSLTILILGVCGSVVEFHISIRFMPHSKRRNFNMQAQPIKRLVVFSINTFFSIFTLQITVRNKQSFEILQAEHIS